jgi:CubicO group peptidase (beta-lactamase class C family)
VNPDVSAASTEKVELGGWTEPAFEPVVGAFVENFEKRRDVGAACSVYVHGQPVVDIWGGVADLSGGRPWSPDTLAVVFSTTKGATAMCAHMLVQRGEIDVDAPVARYWPEFAAAGKERITVRELLSHRAGLYDVQAVAHNADELLDHIGMERRLAAATPRGALGRPAYHAITYGWLASGLARAVTGRGMRDLVRTELAEPLGTSGLEIGTGGGPTKPAEMVGRSLRIYTAFGIAATPLLGWLPVTRAGFRALHAHGFEEICRGPDPAVWRTEMPAVNGALSADGLARLYAPIANGGLGPDGRPFLSPGTVERLGRIQTRGMDRVLGVRMRWRLGFHHAFALGRPGPRALGHYGFGGSGGWGDPDTGVSFGFISSHIGNFTTAIGDLGILRLTAAARACAARAL